MSSLKLWSFSLWHFWQTIVRVVRMASKISPKLFVCQCSQKMRTSSQADSCQMYVYTNPSQRIISKRKRPRKINLVLGHIPFCKLCKIKGKGHRRFLWCPDKPLFCYHFWKAFNSCWDNPLHQSEIWNSTRLSHHRPIRKGVRSRFPIFADD